ncbi:aldolase [Ramicandelaber brevisporus]|nr:aldolase [Ramicandelaber brevisporus]
MATANTALLASDGRPAVYVPLVTPFTSATGEPAYDAIAPHVRWLQDNGIDGIVVGGTTSEAQSLSIAERKKIIDIIVQCAKDGGSQLKVIVGTGCAALPETIELTEYAVEKGADGLLILPPFYFKNVSDAGLIQFYTAVCESILATWNKKQGSAAEDLPPAVLLYHIPPVSQVAVPSAVVGELVKRFPTIVAGYKDSGQIASHSISLLQEHPGFQVFDGTAGLFLECLDAGAPGGIFALANIFPRQFRDLVDAYARKADREELVKLQAKIKELNAVVTKKPIISVIKALLPYLIGEDKIEHWASRVPLPTLSKEDGAEIWDNVKPLISEP